QDGRRGPPRGQDPRHGRPRDRAHDRFRGPEEQDGRRRCGAGREDEGMAREQGPEVLMSDADSGKALATGQSALAALTRAPEWGLLAGILVVLGAIYLLEPSHAFFSAYSLKTLVHNGALFGVLALGAAVVIIAGGIDLSVGAVVALSAVVCTKLITDWLPSLAALKGPVTVLGGAATLPAPAAIGLAFVVPAAVAWGVGSALGQKRLALISA